MCKIIFLLAFVCISCKSKETPTTKKTTSINSITNQRPNIILIMADDMGFSDLGCYGSEIQTPNLDALANNGIRYTQFYNTSRCCPTRTSLLTGLYPHQTGLGWMTVADLERPGYRAEINTKCVTIGEVLKKSGYSTYISGKWHVNKDDECEQDSPKHNWPLQRGFDHFFGVLKGQSDYFSPENLFMDNKQIQSKQHFYFTDAINDTATSFIENHLKTKKNPLFLYVAHVAPHWPLHAKPEDIKKYQGSYLKGWDELRKERFHKMQKLGIIPASAKLSEKDADIQDWESLSDEKKIEMDKRMAIYAAQIDCMDQGIGRIIQTLKKNKQFDNTIILFVSDNGGCLEPISRGKSKTTVDLGTKKSFESYGKPWANTSNTPFRNYKKWQHEGGISTPLIVHWPKGIKSKGVLRSQVGHVIDFMPTFLEVANATYPKKYNGNTIIPLEGKSLVSSFNKNTTNQRTIYFEHIGSQGLRDGDWKLVSLGIETFPYHKKWELYNLKDDRSEINDLALKHPTKVKELDAKWNAWAERAYVLPLDGRSWSQKIKNPLGVQTAP
ncbi:arylsulfatase [Flavobacterium sp. NG2]|uniref:arylsulfatase n=1 Tax=Flavobacterium sp. NG2 TaxID=3097547 RepID=UPI002A832C67|nr:arylsulfatase [Flavobacterium sp. NG2]WPR71951.1 arylsulfatase [Flavobacterium sp. NG2]